MTTPELPPGLDLTEEEADLFRRAYDEEITRRRITYVVLAGLLFAALLATAGWLLRSWPLLLFVSLLYVGITIFEKVAYGRAVLLYKATIRKLAERVRELDG